MERPFVIVIMSYNNKDWYKRNLDSAFSQKYKNFRIVYVDDGSSDGSGQLVEDYVKEKHQEEKVTLIRNPENVGAAANVYNAVNNFCKPYEIVVQLDGDDWFYDENVLSYLNGVYQNSNVWLTYGQFVYWLGDDKPFDKGWAERVSDDVIRQRAFRDRSWCTTALRTFYAGLFHKIKKEDLLYNRELISEFLTKNFGYREELPIYKGEFLPMAHDVAIMFPMLEMAGEHSRFISRVLYVYNIVTPVNDMKKNKNFQEGLCAYIRTLKRYDRIENFLN